MLQPVLQFTQGATVLSSLVSERIKAHYFQVSLIFLTSFCIYLATVSIFSSNLQGMLVYLIFAGTIDAIWITYMIFNPESSILTKLKNM
jgi:hypothetical protein